MLKKTLRSSLRTRHSERDLKKWFDPLILREFDENTFEVRFPHALFAEWFSTENRATLERELARVLGRLVTVDYRTPDGVAVKAPFPCEQETRHCEPPFLQTEDTFCFTRFICNKKNEFPLAMAQELARHPDRQSYFPFVICGKGTCGKTHLLRAIAKAMANGKTAQIYLGSVEDLSACCPEEGTGDAGQQLLRYGAFFLDDAQRLSGHPALQQKLIYVADHFRDHNKPLVLTFDDDLSKVDISDRLRSRLEAGLVVTLKKPDLDVRLRYILAEAAQLNIALQKEQALGLAQRFHDLRNLSGIIKKFSAFCAKNACPPSNADLERLLSHGAENSTLPLTPGDIIHTVSERFSLSPALILGNKRQPDIVQARQISMFLCRDLLGLSFPALGEIFGGKNHATVVYAYKKIQKLQESNKTINNLVSALRKKCLTRKD